jgi:hypothetical protein
MRFSSILKSLPGSIFTALRSAISSIQVVFLIIIAALIVISVPAWWPAIAAFVVPKHDGLIIVNSPTVYTRQRLVNDRLSQTAWLKDQLDATGGPKPPFSSIDQIRDATTQNTSRFGLGNSGAESDERPKSGDGAPLPSGDARSQPNGSSIVVEPTTADFFRAKNAYREEVRSEMMEAQLDDRHDIDGNTIYRLAFGATVLPGTRTDALAVIKIQLSHDPREPVIANEYDRLYEDWLLNMQKTMDKSIDPIVDLINSRHLDSRLTMSLPKFVLKRICEFEFGLTDPNECVPVKGIPGEHPSKQIAYSSGIINRFAEQYVDFRKAIQRSIGTANVRHALADPEESSQSFEFLVRSLDRSCDPDVLAAGRQPVASRTANSGSSGPSNAGEGSPDGPGAILAISGDIVQVRDIVSDRKLNVECPLFDPPSEKIVAGLFLYYKLLTRQAAIGARSPDTQGSSIRSTLNDLANQFMDDLKRGCPEPISPNCTLPNLTKGELRCAAADYMREYLNFFGKPPVGRYRLDRYLNMEFWGPETGSCSINVSAIPPANNNPGGAERLRDDLNKGTELYSYAITPKNLVQHISTALETRDTLQALVKAKGHDLTAALESLRQKSDYNRAIEANPIVLGFGFASGSGPSEPRPSGAAADENLKATEFGWLVAPQMRVGSSERQQVDGQYGLSAVVSLPAWWREVRLIIKTCWISRSALYLYQDYQDQDLCTKSKEGVSGDTRIFTDVARLPVSIAEISHKLAFEVVQEPHIIQTTTTNSPFEVTVGQPAELILRGSRLWRSTEVTLGSQRAEEIVVLPDMEGIIARFKCVKMQRPISGLTVIPVKVFTSEGEAAPEYAHLTPNPDAKLCPDVLRDMGIAPSRKQEDAGSDKVAR